MPRFWAPELGGIFMDESEVRFCIENHFDPKGCPRGSHTPYNQLGGLKKNVKPPGIEPLQKDLKSTLKANAQTTNQTREVQVRVKRIKLI